MGTGERDEERHGDGRGETEKQGEREGDQERQERKRGREEKLRFHHLSEQNTTHHCADITHIILHFT